MSEKTYFKANGKEVQDLVHKVLAVPLEGVELGLVVFENRGKGLLGFSI
jgi:hypothetical protein